MCVALDPLDAEVEAAESWFSERLLVARAADDSTPDPTDGGRNGGHVAELLIRWWARPMSCKTLSANLEELAGHYEQERHNDERSLALRTTFNEGDNPPPPSDDRRMYAAAHYLLALREPEFRLFDAIPAASLLDHLPADKAEDVLEDIRDVCRRCDRGSVPTKDELNLIKKAFQAACKPLGTFKIFRRWNGKGKKKQGVPKEPRRVLHLVVPPVGDFILKYAGRQSCLLRYGRDFLRKDVSEGSGRCIGCKLTLLSESEDALLREIRFYEQSDRPEKRDRLVRSAKRFTLPNPYRRAVEDALSIQRCFVTRWSPEALKDELRTTDCGR